MPDFGTLQRFSDLLDEGYLPAVGAWVQIEGDLTTWLNGYNTLGEQSMELFLLGQAGELVGSAQHTLPTNRVLRLDLADLLGAGERLEGSVWVWSKGATDEGNLGLQAIDLQFVDKGRPAGHVLGSVHLITDFQNTLGIPPWLDLVCPRLLVGRTPEGAPRYRNYLGVAQFPIGSPDPGTFEISVLNQAGEVRTAEPLTLGALASWFGDLAALFPGLDDFLMGPDGRRGYGTLGIKGEARKYAGLAGMVKVVDQQSGEMLVGHLNDRFFARPAMKEP